MRKRRNEKIENVAFENAEDDEMYTFTISCNGKFLKKLAIKSMEEHTTIEDFVFKCILKEIGDKFLEENEK